MKRSGVGHFTAAANPKSANEREGREDAIANRKRNETEREIGEIAKLEIAKLQSEIERSKVKGERMKNERCCVEMRRTDGQQN